MLSPNRWNLVSHKRRSLLSQNVRRMLSTARATAMTHQSTPR
jgi:hypothetical protein